MRLNGPRGFSNCVSIPLRHKLFIGRLAAVVVVVVVICAALDFGIVLQVLCAVGAPTRLHRRTKGSIAPPRRVSQEESARRSPPVTQRPTSQHTPLLCVLPPPLHALAAVIVFRLDCLPKRALPLLPLLTYTSVQGVCFLNPSIAGEVV